MKVMKTVAILVMMLFTYVVKAQCPTQETTVVFMNGVWTSIQSAEDYKDELAEAVYLKDVKPECVHFTFSHTQDDARVTDITEAIIQKSQEVGGNAISDSVMMLLRVISPNPSFITMVADYLSYTQDVVATQTEKHLQAYKKAILSDAPHAELRQRGIMVTHSQGGLYANAVWGKLTTEEQSKTHVVTVATPANHVANFGSNTRLSRDGVANLFFANALMATTPNTVLCKNETNPDMNSWDCHGFDTGYMHDPASREKIVNDIIAQLPPGSTTSGPVKMSAEILNGYYLKINTPIPQSNAWALTNVKYSNFSEIAFGAKTCSAQGPYSEWYTQSWGGVIGNFNITGYNLNIALVMPPGSFTDLCSTPGIFYFLVFDIGNYPDGKLVGYVTLKETSLQHWEIVP